MASVDRSVRHALLARVAVVAVVGLALGVATSYLQGVLPGPVNFLPNSGAVWTLFACALAWWVVAGPTAPAVVVGVVAQVARRMFVGEGVHAAVVLGYPTQAAIELGVAVAVLFASARVVVRSPRDVGFALISVLAVGALVAAAYSVV